MATLEQIVQFQTSVLGESTRRVGGKAVLTNFDVDGAVYDTGNIVVADNYGAKTLWTSPGGGITSFDWLLFTTNRDVYIELVNTVPATDERLLLKVLANSYLVLPSSVMGGYASNTSRLDGAALVSATDFNLITEIRVQRDAADLDGDASVRLVLID
jgi:hypothetical protein